MDKRDGRKSRSKAAKAPAPIRNAPSADAGISFYFFDFDDNIMFLSTPIFVRNTVTKEDRPLSTGEFANVSPLLGRPGPWENYAIVADSYRNFRDIPPSQLPARGEQPFVADVRAAITSAKAKWQGPSWKFFVYACEHQRPLSIVTARGHSPDTVKAGVRVLADQGLIRKEPNYHTIFPVSNPAVIRQLGADKEMTTPALKRLAIIKTVEAAVARFPSEQNLRFGMSDDDPQNVNLIIRAMSDCKQRFPDKRFFVINTHMKEEVKLEVFSIDTPVVGRPRKAAADVLA
jgi:hypothetical protein